jgi:hypothetical protein
MKRFQFLLLFLSIVFTASSQDLPWSKSSPLSWNDFKAAPDENNPFFAVTHAGFGYKYNANQDSLHISTSTNFKPALSWVKKPSDHLLGHEQLHFDIAEYYRRVFVERLSKATIALGSAKQFLPELYAQVLAELRSEQKLYDEQTKHSVDKEAQENWRLKYAERLNRSIDIKALHIGFAK